MTIIAHISDLHFGRERSRLIEGLLDCLHKVQPDAILISGDLTQRAKHDEYRAAGEFLQKLDQPYLVVPGNHDLSATNLFERFRYPWQKWQRAISTHLEPALEAAGYVAVGINTARKRAALLDWSRGRINQNQIDRVLTRLQKRGEQQLGLLVAHHPFWLPEEYLHRGLIGRRDAAMQAFQGKVDIILSGHVHLPYIKALHGVIISHAGTTTSSRLVPGFPNNFNLVKGNHQSLQIERMAWDEESFHCELSCAFHHKEDGWSAAETNPKPCRAIA